MAHVLVAAQVCVWCVGGGCKGAERWVDDADRDQQARSGGSRRGVTVVRHAAVTAAIAQRVKVEAEAGAHLLGHEAQLVGRYGGRGYRGGRRYGEGRCGGEV